MLGKNLIQAAAGAGAAGEVLGVEDVFSTWLYTGNGSAQTIPNGIDLAGKGGMIFYKNRNGTWFPTVVDTVTGLNRRLFTNLTNAADLGTTWGFTALSNGYSIYGSNVIQNGSGLTYVSWTFRKARKFFDVVTWTGDGTSGRAIPHNLGSAPGFIVARIFSSTNNWECYHRGITFNSGNVLWLNSANAVTTGDPRFTSVPDATNFYLGSDSSVNESGQTYVAYLFAHDAGGFGSGGTESVIKCGSYTGTGATLNVDCGFTAGAQFVLIKRTDSTSDWYVWDTARGIVSGDDPYLLVNSSAAEVTNRDYIDPLSSGFQISSSAADAINTSGGSYIFLAIA